MSNDLETQPEAGVLELLSGIITDVHVLTKQQLALFRHETKEEIVHAREAGTLVAIGFAIVVMGSLLICGMLVHLLVRMAPGLPLWGSYGIVGAPIAVLGGIICIVGVQRFRSVDTTSIEQTRDFEENVNG
jgi:flagellar biosynthesis protein FliR